MNTRNLWVVARVGKCCRCECAGCGQYGWVQMDCPPQWFADEFGSPGMLRTMFVIGNSTWRYDVWFVAWFPHVLYRLWPIGVASRRLEILTKRCRTRITWLWPCGWAGTSLLDVHWYYMVVAMWKEGNESSLVCIGITWLWPCDKEGGGSLVVKWYYIWLWPCGIKEEILFWCSLLYIICLVYIFVLSF